MKTALRPPAQSLSKTAKAATLAELEVLGNQDHRPLVATAVTMEPQHIMGLLLQTAGKLAVSEATPSELRGALLMATVWISAAGEAMAAQKH